MNKTLIVLQCHVELQSVLMIRLIIILLRFTQKRITLLRLLMTSNNLQSILKERSSISIVVSILYYINITSFICIQTLM
jgi:hypothetical protein